MALLKDELLKENFLNFMGDIPAYAFIAYANFLQVLPSEYPDWEFFLLKHGWLMLLFFRLMIAVYDLVIRLNGNYFLVDVDGKPRKRSLMSIISNLFKELVK
jgi:hypothetical protein